MKVLIDISDKEAAFGMQVLKSLSFVKQANAIPYANVGLWEDLQEAAEQVRLHKLGKIELKTVEEILDEL
jgi:hypothetical protein